MKNRCNCFLDCSGTDTLEKSKQGAETIASIETICNSSGFYISSFAIVNKTIKLYAFPNINRNSGVMQR